jgi:hypothetical protein
MDLILPVSSSIEGIIPNSSSLSSLADSVNRPDFFEESVNSNSSFMDLGTAQNQNPYQSFYTAEFLQRILLSNSYFFYSHFYMATMTMLLPVVSPSGIHWIPIPYFSLYPVSIYPIGGAGADLVPPGTAPTGPAEVSDSLSRSVSQSPLEQFAIHPIFDLFIDPFFFSFTNLSFSMLLTLGFVLLGFFLKRSLS